MKFIIEWDAGFGTTYKEIEADSVEEANNCAYEHCREEFENNCSYAVTGEATEELREDYL